jgi:hypothetical protein
MDQAGYFTLLLILLLTHCNTPDPVQIRNNDIVDYDKLRWENDHSTLVFSNNDSILSGAINLREGKYVMRFSAEATSANSITPHFVIGLGNYILKDIYLEKGKKEYLVKFELPEKINARVRFMFDNDFNDTTSDRNIFLRFPISISSY